MEIFSCFSIFFPKIFIHNQDPDSKQNQPASRDLSANIIINSESTKIKLSEDLIMEMKRDEDFESRFHNEFMDFVLRYENVIIYQLEDEHIWQIVNETFSRWIIAIKIHPLSSEYFDERRAICRIFTDRSYLFRNRFYEKFESLYLNSDKFEEPEQSAIYRSRVIWGLMISNNCDDLEYPRRLRL